MCTLLARRSRPRTSANCEDARPATDLPSRARRADTSTACVTGSRPTTNVTKSDDAILPTDGRRQRPPEPAPSSLRHRPRSRCRRHRSIVDRRREPVAAKLRRRNPASSARTCPIRGCSTRVKGIETVATTNTTLRPVPVTILFCTNLKTAIDSCSLSIKTKRSARIGHEEPKITKVVHTPRACGPRAFFVVILYIYCCMKNLQYKTNYVVDTEESPLTFQYTTYSIAEYTKRKQ